MSTDRIKTLKEFLASHPGDRWYKVNLHVHGAGNSVSAIVDAAIAANLDMIAITDHNSFAFYKDIKEEAAKRKGSNLVVLPGIEITLEEGAHLIAIFDQNFDEKKQANFIGQLKLPHNATEKDAVRDQTCSQILEEISRAGGITMVPHPYSSDIGFLDKARKIPTKLQWLETGNIGLIQLSDDKVKYVDFDKNGKWQNRYVLASAPPEAIFSSDYCLSPITSGEAQKPNEIENGVVWLKLGALSVSGLRQVTCEPRTRISREAPEQNNDNMILGLTVKGGYFDGLKISFSPNMTLIFGDNHSGKSAIFDFISFALGRDIGILARGARKDEYKTLLRRLNAILQGSGEVDFYFKKNGKSYCLTRTFIPKFDKNNDIDKIDSRPTAFVYDSQNDKLDPVNWVESDLMTEIYSQGYVGVLRNSVETLLSLIDELAGLSETGAKKELLLKQLANNADLLAGKFDEKEEVAGRLGKLKELGDKLKECQKELKDTNYDKWQNTAKIIENVQTRISQLETGQSLPEFLTDLEVESIDYDKKDVINEEIIDKICSHVKKYNEGLSKLTEQIKNEITTLISSCTPLIAEWEKGYEENNKKVAKELREKGFESPEQLLNQVNNIQTEINDINKNDAPKNKKLEDDTSKLLAERNQLLIDYRVICEEIRTKRKQKISELDAQVGSDIQITLDAPDLKNYQDLLQTIYDEIASSTQKIQKREEQFEAIAKSVEPSELEEALLHEGKFKKNSDGLETELCDHCGVTRNTQKVLCSISGSIKSLHKLQIFENQPVPRIKVKREGTTAYADLMTGLSPGEQSAAILTLALMTRDTPLLIDQPEDELGYGYIVNRIVPKIIDAKSERQIILISHNANIPVLGDAELLLKVRNDPTETGTHCHIEKSGTFAEQLICDCLLELEGGERAFQIRQYRYATPKRHG